MTGKITLPFKCDHLKITKITILPRNSVKLSFNWLIYLQMTYSLNRSWGTARSIITSLRRISKTGVRLQRDETFLSTRVYVISSLLIHLMQTVD